MRALSLPFTQLFFEKLLFPCCGDSYWNKSVCVCVCARGVPSRHGDPREDKGEALPHPRLGPTPAPRRPAPAMLPVPSQPQWGSPEHNWDRPPSPALEGRFLTTGPPRKSLPLLSE